MPEAQTGMVTPPIRIGKPKINLASCTAATKPKMSVATLLKERADMRDLLFADG